MEIQEEKSERLLLIILRSTIAKQPNDTNQTIGNGHNLVTVLLANLYSFTDV